VSGYSSDDASGADVDEDEAEATLGIFETDNPWLKKVFAMSTYGQAPAKAIELLHEVSPDQEERIITALRVKHGSYRRGYLIATTSCLRYVQTLPGRSENYWGYDYKLEIAGGMGQGGVIRTQEGEQFQARWGKVKQFRELYNTMQHAAAWDAEHKPQPTPVVVQNAPGLSDELEKLAALHAQGVLNDEEFQDAKQKLLSA
jgi:hypothetical protein